MLFLGSATTVSCFLTELLLKVAASCECPVTLKGKVVMQIPWPHSCHLMLVTVLGRLLVSDASGVLAQSDVHAEQRAQSVLQQHCFKCHGTDAREGGLRMISGNDLLSRNDSGEPAVIPGDSQNSELVRRVSSDDKEIRMPPEGPSLSKQEIQILRNWIDAGAEWSDSDMTDTHATHWAYLQPIRPAVPIVRNQQAVINPVDAFVIAELEAKQNQLSPAAREIPARLLRRVYLDLIGIPPSPSEVDAFVVDPNQQNFEQIVDRLLESQQYGEKWARQWLDMARYADTNGYQADQFRSVWAYRDWVINAMNADLPFNQFTIEQLAGDLLPQATVEQRIATGFHRLTTCNVEAGVDPEENRINQVADRVSTTGAVWLGTTLECARCHNHKYDPFTQQEFYQLFAFFNNTPLEVDPPANGGVQYEVAGPMMKLPLPSTVQQEQERLQADLDNLRQQYTARTRELANADSDSEQQHPELAALKQKMESTEKALQQIKPEFTAVMVELAEPRESAIFRRGDFLNRGAVVEPATPARLHQFQADGPANRLDLARWLVSDQNPLVARVTVNRWWAEFFGRGIVDTLEDFGTQGSRPTHPELLDWLAVEFMQHGWSMKHIHRLIVTSGTYQQSSRQTLQMREQDPLNTLYARGARFRMSAESIRDNALAISGLLSSKMGGPPVYPPQPDNIWRHVGRNAPKYQTSHDEDRFRRGIYVVWRRSAPYPSFVNFDAPDRASCVINRSRSNTPLQALTLLNDPAFVEMALALSLRIQQEKPAETLPSQLEYGFRLCVARTPSTHEVLQLTDLWNFQNQRFDQDAESAEKLIPSAQRLPEVPLSQQAAWFAVANVLLNLDETITKN